LFAALNFPEIIRNRGTDHDAAAVFQVLRFHLKPWAVCSVLADWDAKGTHCLLWQSVQ